MHCPLNGKCSLTLGKIQYQNQRADFESKGTQRALLPSEGIFTSNLRADFETEGNKIKTKKKSAVSTVILEFIMWKISPFSSP